MTIRIFITGSTDGIGLAAAKSLSERGAKVTLHARNADKAKATHEKVPKAEGVLIGDLSTVAAAKKLAEDANATGQFDAIIHNAGIGFGSTTDRSMTSDGTSTVFAVNTLAPYIMTCLMYKPKSRLLFMSSDSHYGGDGSLKDATTSHSYGSTKLHDTMLANAFARRWPEVQILSLHPGWISTKMGGAGAPDPLHKATETLTSWALGEGPYAKLPSGTFFTTSGKDSQHKDAGDVSKQEQLLKICEEVSGCKAPGESS